MADYLLKAPTEKPKKPRGGLANFRGRMSPGRPKGVRNKAAREIKERARDLMENPDYLKALKRRLEAGRAPHMETLLCHYAYGKPKEVIEYSGPGGGPIQVQPVPADLARLTLDQLQQLRQLAEKAQEE